MMGIKWTYRQYVLAMTCICQALVNSIGGHAQIPQSNLRCKTIHTTNHSIVLDSLLIDQNSITVIPDVKFELNQSKSTIQFEKDNLPVEICYRVLNLNVRKPIYHLSPELYDSTALFKDQAKSRAYAYQRDELFTTPEIQKTGSLTRGVTFGNSQSLNVNSMFNFQMDGKLTDELNIRADITDQNIPFQPEGNTLQLREFDNVTFEIYNDRLSFLAGDILMQNRNSTFLRYNKNALGGQFNVNYELGDGIKGRSRLAIASAKGQFADINIPANEGVQGPYQLFGPAGLKYVIVMANSEQVYIDGRLMTRGFNNDYTIDYNLGEITFMPNVPITEFTRIRVTFEYSDQNYSRSIVNAEQGLSIGKTDLTLTYYKEQDNKNRPLSFDLTNNDLQRMAEAGDEQLPVPIAGDNLTSYSQDLVLFEKQDTIDADGILREIFVFSTDSTAELYRVTFTEVGDGNGDYQLVSTDVNGRVFEWVSPSGGISSGNYAPVRFVPAPNKREMLAIAAKSRLTNHVEAFADFALSNHDQNLLSTIGNEDNQDIAFKGGMAFDKIEAFDGYQFSGQVDYEYNGKDFRAIDRFRAIEFDRNWSYNASIDTFRTANHIFNVGMKLSKDERNSISTSLSTRKKQFAIDGYQYTFEANKQLGNAQLKGSYFNMQNESLLEQSTWMRWFGEVYYDQFVIVPGYKVEEDRNEVGLAEKDSLTRSAMNFIAHQFYLRNREDVNTKFSISYQIRDNRKVNQGDMIDYSRVNATNFGLTTPTGKNNQLLLNLTHRVVKYTAAFSELEDENFLLGRFNWKSSMLKRHVRSDITYTTSSSREILREFVFVEVTPGEGTHTWRDLNENGIQEVTEFFEALNFDERNYIKVFVPSDQTVDAYNTVFNANINLTMPRSWKGHGAAKDLFSRFQNQLSININKKTTGDDQATRFNPFDLSIDNADLLFVRDLIRNTLFYNRGKTGFGGDITYLQSQGKQFNVKGLDSRSNRELSVNFRFNLNRELTVQWNYKNGKKRNASEFQENRNFLIQSHQVGPGLIWQPENNLRLSVNYDFKMKTNLETELTEEFSKISQVKLEGRWSKGVKNALNVSFGYSDISHRGDLNTAVSYELLEALQPGANYNWRLNYNQKLASGLQLSVGYEGRKSTNQRTIQMGRMQLTALF